MPKGQKPYLPQPRKGERVPRRGLIRYENIGIEPADGEPSYVTEKRYEPSPDARRKGAKDRVVAEYANGGKVIKCKPNGKAR